MILSCICGNWCQNIMETFIISFFLRKSVKHQQDAINEHKIIRSVFLTVQWFEIVAEWLLRKQVFRVVAWCGWVIYSWRFKEIYCLHLQSYEWIYRLKTLRMKAVCSFKTSGSIFPTNCCNNPEDLLPQYENRFATSKIIQHWCMSGGQHGKLTP